MPGDRIVQINGQPIRTYGQLQDFLVAHADDDLTVTVARSKEAGGKEGKPEETENVQVTVPKSPMKQFGLIMAMGPIAAIQTGSPAAKAGIQPGDLLKTIDGKPVADPMRLPRRTSQAGRDRGHAGPGTRRKTAPGESQTVLPPCYAPSETPDSPVAISELGVAYYVSIRLPRSSRTVPLPKAGLQAGDRITKAKIMPPSAEQLAELRKKYHDDDLDQSEVTLPFADDERNWPYLLVILQNRLPGTTVEFTWQRGDKEMTGKATPVPAKDWFDSQRGWNLEPMMFVEKASSFAEAWRWGWQETVDATLLVYRSLHSVVGTKQISVRNLSGPLGIVRVALMQARAGVRQSLDLPHPAQRQPGRDQLPADPRAGRRTHGVVAL